MKKNTAPDKRPTAADVARLAGVSRTQVSYVLNNTRMDHVSQANRERILNAAKELNYQPHTSAQNLRRGYSKEFSIFFPAPYSPRINGMIGAIHEAGLAGGFLPVQYSFHSYKNKERKQEAMDSMLSRKPYGVFCSLLDLEREDLFYMRERGVREILVWDVEMYKDFPTLYLPVKEIGSLAAEHLMEKGYVDMAIIKPSDPVQSRAFKLRYKGFSKKLADHKVKVRILSWPENALRPDLKSAHEFLEKLLSEGTLPRAVYAYSDDYALPLLAALRKKGISVPEEIAILGTDDNIYSELVTPQLSTIRMDADSLGRRAVAMMNHLITGEPLESAYRKPPVPLLVEREST